MSTIKKGRLGYNITENKLLRNDWDIYIPVLEDTKIDCIILKNKYLWKIQIKTLLLDKKTNKKYLPVRKIGHNEGEYKIHHYTSDEIDFFFGIDTDTNDVYVCPISFIEKYGSSISLSTLQPYKNNFSLLEPYNRDIISGADDIGETLTGNTEGTR